ncbi:MAG: hypothetical protein MJZ34_16435 [Paludibacteraceae bacterium]|nr:hypothetical protein [Paludibacteraceae bacterium]
MFKDYLNFDNIQCIAKVDKKIKNARLTHQKYYSSCNISVSLSRIKFISDIKLQTNTLSDKNIKKALVNLCALASITAATSSCSQQSATTKSLVIYYSQTHAYGDIS